VAKQALKRSTARPLLWLAALLAIYLCAPFIASVPQLGAADWPNVDWRAVWYRRRAPVWPRS
jgi:hypothetical protein